MHENVPLKYFGNLFSRHKRKRRKLGGRSMKQLRKYETQRVLREGA